MRRKLQVWVLISVAASVLLQLFFFVQALLLSQMDRFFPDVRSVMLNFIFAFLIAILLLPLDNAVISWLNGKYPWRKHFLLRIVLGTLAAILAGMLSGTLVTWLFYLAIPSRNLWPNIASNLIITPIANIIAFSIAEAYHIFIEWNKSQLLAERLEKENALARFDMLKQQLNPHFLFNSLSVLSGLVHKDANKSEEFIHKFSDIYRYLLQTATQPLVPVHEELELAESYVFLQQIRFGESFQFMCQLDERNFPYFLPPMTLQLLLENAIKHNEVSADKKLVVTLKRQNGYLLISNNKQLRYASSRSMGTGLKNLTERYRMLCGQEPVVTSDDQFFTVKVPLITSAPHGYTDNRR